MNQTHKSSISEAIANIIPGYFINYFANFVILPPFCMKIVEQVQAHDYGGLSVTMISVGILYTFVSIARQYILRRAFIRLGHDANFYTMLLMLKNRIKGVINGKKYKI